MDKDDKALAFRTIRDMVDDIWNLLGDSTKKSPLHIYYNLIHNINEEKGGVPVDRVVGGFNNFCKNYGDDIESLIDNINEDSKIYYQNGKENIFLEIGKFLKISNEEQKETIRKHLLMIIAVLNPSDEVFSELEKNNSDSAVSQFLGSNIDTDTNEGKFINDTINTVKDTMENVDSEDPITGLLTSGALPEVMNSVKEGVSSGQLDHRKMLSYMQNALGSLQENMDKISEQQNN